MDLERYFNLLVIRILFASGLAVGAHAAVAEITDDKERAGTIAIIFYLLGAAVALTLTGYQMWVANKEDEGGDEDAETGDSDVQ